MIRHRWLYCCLSVFLPAVLLAAMRSLSSAKPEPPAPTWQMVGQIGGPTNAVAVQGDYAYVGVGLRLIVLDVSDPAAPVEVGSTTPFPYFVEDVSDVSLLIEGDFVSWA